MKFIVSASMICSLTIASNTFFENNKEGYFYYKDSQKATQNQEKKQKKENQSKVVSTTDYNSTMTKMNIPFENDEQREYRKKREKEYMENIPWSDLDNLSADEYRRMLDTTREISVATPSKQYVKTYAALQKFWIDKSEKFSKVWQVATLENPDELLYSDNETSAAGRKIRNKKLNDEKLDFFKKINSRAGYIVIIDGEEDSENYRGIETVFNYIKNKTGMDYKIIDYYAVPAMARKLKIDIKGLPDVFMLYMGNENKEVYKRVARGYASAEQIIDNTKFVFENGVLEKDKRIEDRNKD